MGALFSPAFLLHLLLLLLLLICTSITAAAAAGAEDDKAFMSDFLKAFKTPPSGWDPSSDYCKWKGVNCDTNNRVTSINLSSQDLEATIPPSLNTLTQLTTLSLQNNHFTGALPSLANLSSLEQVFLNSNNFTSIPPSAFSGLTSLQSLSLSSNLDLAPWPFPSEIADSTALASFYADDTRMEGPIPDVFGSLRGLQNLRLSYNSLNGSLPNSFNGSAIQYLWLNNLGLSGSIDVISGMTQLAQVWLHGNSFNTPIPDLSACTQIFDLQLRDNQLVGIVPETLVSLPNLQNVTLNNNHLQGPLPVFPKNVITVNLDQNNFCRTTPGDCDPQVTALLKVAEALGYPVTLAQSWTGNDPCNAWTFVNCDSNKRVITVNFAKRGFSGTISPAFADLKSLTDLYLNDNNLTGTIPAALASLPKLKRIDLTNNDISGKVPSFRPEVTLLKDGNKNIGKDVPAPGGPPGSEPSSSTGSGGGSKGSSVSVGMVVGVVVVVLVFVVVVMFVLYKCYMKRRHRKFGKVENPEVGNEMVKTNVMEINAPNGYAGVPSELQSQSSGDHGEFRVFEGSVFISIQVLRQVTNNFSENNILGSGGFGVVYKGELHDGTKIAVKRMESGAMGTKGMNEFQAEIAVLTKVRHRHLVALLGFCTTDNERLLVYEYMPQGHLGQHLFDWHENGLPFLTWKQRVSIALDVARGVEYLHSLAQTSFIHRDLKPSNILLGDDMRAKVADFGLVKNAPDGKSSMATRLAGTFGYLAPEYAVTGRVTTKIDVYAFGIILMELITGRKALDETLPDERSHLVTWFRRLLINKDNIQKAVDSNLNIDDEETFESILRVADLAGHCTAREPQQRPDMGHAVNVLGPLVEQWKPSCQEEDDAPGNDLGMSLPQALERWQANEGSSTMMSDFSYSRTQASIPAKPSGFADSFDSMDCR